MKLNRNNDNKDHIYLSSLFSATLRGIALSILTLSPTDRFCRLFTKRSLLLTVTHTGAAALTLETYQSYYSSVLSVRVILLTLGVFCVRTVALYAIASYARPGRAGKVSDGGSALPASPKLHGPVVVLRDDGSPAAT